MKKTITLLILILSYSLSAQTWGNGEYWISYEYTPKPDQISEFEKAVKEKTNKWNTNLETSIFTFEVVNGPNSGTYERWVTRKDRSFFDQDFSKEIEYWKKNVGKYIADQSGQQTWRIFKGASYGWDAENTNINKFYQQNRVVVKAGKTAQFLRAHERMAKLMDALNYSGNRAVFRIVNGGNTREFAVVYGFDQHGGDGSGTWNDLPEGSSLQDAYNEMFGYEAWTTDWQASSEAIELWGNLAQKTRYRPELSTKL